jgi:hypothetical protein
MSKKLYEVELKRVFNSLVVNYPHIYKGLNFSDLAADWYSLFTKYQLPAEKVFSCYENVIEYRVTTGNDFGAVSGLDMLAAYKRLNDMTLGTKKQIVCEVCNGEGFVIAYDLNSRTNLRKKCPRQH